jgi:serine/threonine protein kinase
LSFLFKSACGKDELTGFALTDILIDYQGQLKLSDFGAAKILAKGQKTMGRTSVHMNVNSLAGTPMYMVKKSKFENSPCILISFYCL